MVLMEKQIAFLNHDMLDSNPAKKVKNHFQEKAVTDRKSDERYA